MPTCLTCDLMLWPCQHKLYKRRVIFLNTQDLIKSRKNNSHPPSNIMCTGMCVCNMRKKGGRQNKEDKGSLLCSQLVFADMKVANNISFESKYSDICKTNDYIFELFYGLFMQLLIWGYSCSRLSRLLQHHYCHLFCCHLVVGVILRIVYFYDGLQKSMTVVFVMPPMD